MVSVFWSFGQINVSINVIHDFQEASLKKTEPFIFLSSRKVVSRTQMWWLEPQPPSQTMTWFLRMGATERRSLRHHESTILALKLSTSRPLLCETDCECPDCLLWVQALQHLRYDCVVQLLSCVQLFATPWTATCQASLSFTISWSLLKLMSIESMISFNYLILCHTLLLLCSIPASESFPKNWLFTSGGQTTGASASATVLPINIQGWFPLGLTGLISLLSKKLSRVFSSTTVQKSINCLHSTFFMVQLLEYMTTRKDKIGEDSWDCWAPGGGQANQAPGSTTLQVVHDKTNSISMKPELQFAHRLRMISVWYPRIIGGTLNCNFWGVFKRDVLRAA